MTNYRPTKTSCFIKYLASLDCIEMRTRGSHTQFKCPEAIRTVTVRKNDKEVPALHIKTNLSNIGLAIGDYYKWASENKCA